MDCVKRLFKKEQIFTIPNLLTVVRLLMIPVIIDLYCNHRNYPVAAALVLVSGLTDVVDGIIARKLNQISDLGKIIDPIADKLTQLTLLYCLMTKYTLMLPMMILFVVKELTQGIFSLLAFKRENKVNSSQWFGKLNTVTLYLSMAILFFFPDISSAAANLMIVLCAFTTILSLVKYLRFYIGILCDKKGEKASC